MRPTTLNPVLPSHHNSIHFNPFFPIVTPFNPDAWDTALSSSNLHQEFSDAADGIRFGFDMGTSSIINAYTYIPPNHKSATLHPNTIIDNINSELQAHRYSGPFHPDRLTQIIGHFRSSPLGLVPKSDGGFRLIQDFSFPRNDPSIPSVNAHIDLNNFHCNWGTFNKISDIVMNTPQGTLMATMDVDAAFRRCPIHPSQRQNFVVHWEGLCYIDHCAPFGAASSGFVFGRVADAFVAILESRGIKSVINWVDDFAIPFYPVLPNSHTSQPIFLFTLETLYQIASDLGWPWKQSKTRPPALQFTYLGFLWDIPNKTVEIPLNKKTKYLKKLESWVPGNKFTRREAENLLGTLVHCSLAIPTSRTHLPSLTHFVASFNGSSSPHIRKSPNASVFKDIEWWMLTLSSNFCGSTLSSPPPPCDISFWVDASTSWGIGVVFDKEWSSWRLKEGWQGDGRTIGWAEFLAIEFGLLLAIKKGHSNIHFIIHSDNQGVIFAFSKGRSRSYHQNQVLQRINTLCAIHCIWITCRYTPSSSNLADAPSRGLDIPHLIRSTTDIDIHPSLLPFLT
ncbi:hypothetical protein CVT24_007515 [Panaeolus cyanescens]|uniref:Reverse transcriptase domain-containing protein n=1 Tax=Panaeolus cyanescens TaxID=181874 RepID=A0A409YW96_9AGAR|nr:hypothetical protein CVT24_007515 [Panaeolus cyanescens]